MRKIEFEVNYREIRPSDIKHASKFLHTPLAETDLVIPHFLHLFFGWLQEKDRFRKFRLDEIPKEFQGQAGFSYAFEHLRKKGWIEKHEDLYEFSEDAIRECYHLTNGFDTYIKPKAKAPDTPDAPPLSASAA